MDVLEFTFAFLLIIALIALFEAGAIQLLIYINKYGFDELVKAAGEELTDFIEQTADYIIKIFK